MDRFFDQLERIYARYPEFAHDGNLVWNLDETSTTTVSKTPKVVAQKGVHQVNQITSAERGILTTTCCFINAAGNTIPPIIVYPRKNFKSYMIKGAPTGTKALCSSTGWMTDELFVDVMAHFIEFTKPSKDRPIFLLYDNHSSHVSLKATQLAKANGVIILTIPPHTSHRVQPLDVGVYSSFKHYYSLKQKQWTELHPGQTITLAEIPEFVSFAHEQAMSKSNIISGFRATGIFPCNRYIFTDNDYAPSIPTDRPDPELEPIDDLSPPQSITTQPIQSSSETNTSSKPTCASSSTMKFVSPFEFKGVPKAGARKKSNRGRKPKSSTIITDTPEQDRLKLEEAAKLKKVVRVKKSAKVRKLVFSEESSEEEVEPMRIKANGKKASALTVDSSESNGSSESEESKEEEENDEDFGVEKLKEVGDFILAVFSNDQKKNLVHYVGRIIEISGKKAKISFLKRSEKYQNAWIYPYKEDISWITFNQILMVLPPPTPLGTTKRQMSYLKFDAAKTEKKLKELIP